MAGASLADDGLSQKCVSQVESQNATFREIRTLGEALGRVFPEIATTAMMVSRAVRSTKSLLAGSLFLINGCLSTNPNSGILSTPTLTELR
jgi:hypothetical protein